MPPKSKLNWTYGGRPIDPREIKAEILDSYENVGSEAVKKLTQDTKNLVTRLKNRAAKDNPYALGNPFQGTEVETYEREPGVWRIRVIGDVFNLLDQGRPSITLVGKKHYMTFPRYRGTITSPNSSTVSTKQRSYPGGGWGPNQGDWVSTDKVSEIAPRNFLAELIKNRESVKSTKKQTTKKSRFKWSFDPNEAYIKVVKGDD